MEPQWELVGALSNGAISNDCLVASNLDLGHVIT